MSGNHVIVPFGQVGAAAAPSGAGLPPPAPPPPSPPPPPPPLTGQAPAPTVTQVSNATVQSVYAGLTGPFQVASQHYVATGNTTQIEFAATSVQTPTGVVQLPRMVFFGYQIGVGAGSSLTEQQLVEAEYQAIVTTLETDPGFASSRAMQAILQASAAGNTYYSLRASGLTVNGNPIGGIGAPINMERVTHTLCTKRPFHHSSMCFPEGACGCIPLKQVSVHAT